MNLADSPDEKGTVTVRPRPEDGRGILVHDGEEAVPFGEWYERQRREWAARHQVDVRGPVGDRSGEARQA